MKGEAPRAKPKVRAPVAPQRQFMTNYCRRRRKESHYSATNRSLEEVLADFPYLTREDIQACLACAAALEKAA